MATHLPVPGRPSAKHPDNMVQRILSPAMLMDGKVYLPVLTAGHEKHGIVLYVHRVGGPDRLFVKDTSQIRG